MNNCIYTDEAAQLSGLSPFSIRKFAREGAFEADQVAGRQGGWRINRMSFLIWYNLRREKTGNAVAKRSARKALANLSGTPSVKHK